MKRYLIFAALAPPLGGFFVLLANTVMSGYWSHPPNLSETEKLVAVFAKTFQYSYLLGILPALMIGAVDDIVFHIRRIRPVVRMLIIGLLASVAAEFFYGSRGPDSGILQFLLYGMVGFIPGVVCSWLAHEAIDLPDAPGPGVTGEPEARA